MMRIPASMRKLELATCVVLLVISQGTASLSAKDPCGKTDWQKVGEGDHEVTVWKVVNPPGFLFTSEMAIDADGSPRAYHPDNTGLDDNRNAKNSGSWVGVVTIDGKPVIQGKADPAPGFYVSPTTLEDKSRKLGDPGRYVDSETVPYIALPPEVLKADGARMGDMAAVVNLKNDTLAFAIVADRGPKRRIGEGSIALANALGINASPRSGGAASGVAYLVFGASGNGQPRSIEAINSEGAKLLAIFGDKSRLGSCASPQEPEGPSPIATEVERLVQAFAGALKNSRYMEQDCGPATYPDWDAFPLSKCRYSVTDKGGARKTAIVIMLNPSIKQLAQWVVTSCREVTRDATPSCTEHLMKWIIGQSGGQFPVAGVVFEDILPSDEVYELYCFRDGVTIKVKGFPHLGTKPPTAEEVAECLSAPVVWVGKYARLQSTTPEQYRSNGGREDVGDDSKRSPAWLEVNRKLYQAAWAGDRNELMVAWARQQYR